MFFVNNIYIQTACETFALDPNDAIRKWRFTCSVLSLYIVNAKLSSFVHIRYCVAFRGLYGQLLLCVDLH